MIASDSFVLQGGVLKPISPLSTKFPRDFKRTSLSPKFPSCYSWLGSVSETNVNRPLPGLKITAKLKFASDSEVNKFEYRILMSSSTMSQRQPRTQATQFLFSEVLNIFLGDDSITKWYHAWPFGKLAIKFPLFLGKICKILPQIFPWLQGHLIFNSLKSWYYL